MYYKINNYIDDDGKTIVTKTPVSDGISDILPQSKTYGMLQITARTPHGMAQIPFEFEFPDGMTLQKCFDEFEEIAKIKFEEFKKEQEDKNRIIPASSVMPTPSNTIEFPRK